MQQKITPNLWFDHNAEEAVEFYTSIFPNSKIIAQSNYPTEDLADFQKEFAGKVLTIEFELNGYHFMAINAGPDFKPNASVSFMINFDPSFDEDAERHLNEVWDTLSEDGEVLMQLDEYPYSKRYGWVKDKYNVSWQLMLTDPKGEPRPYVIPSLMFMGANNNRAEEAMLYYQSVFGDTRQGVISRYEDDTGPAAKGSIMFADFTLAGQWFAIMDSGVEHNFTFNEGISLSVACKDQAEIDALWDELSTVPEAEQCGWCKDKFGLSWQIVPDNIDELMEKPGTFAKMSEMKKLVIAEF